MLVRRHAAAYRTRGQARLVPTGGLAGERRAVNGRPYGGYGRGAAGRGTRPLRRKTSRICHCEGRYGPWQSVSPVPISNVFKSQFENITIFNFQLSIFNSPAAGCMWRTMFAATGGLQRAGRMAGRLPALQAGAGGETAGAQ